MAKKFIFRLNSVLKLREHKAKAEKQALMNILSLRFLKENEINATEEYFHSISEDKKGTYNISDFQAQIFHRNSVKFKIKKLNDEKQQLIELENIQRNTLKKAETEEKVIVKLKERKHQAYIDEIGKEETKILDEIARNRHGFSNSLDSLNSNQK